MYVFSLFLFLNLKLYFPFRQCFKFSTIPVQQQGLSLTENVKKKPLWFYNNKAIRQRKVNQVIFLDFIKIVN